MKLMMISILVYGKNHQFMEAHPVTAKWVDEIGLST
jgi:hypothetical protein